MLIVIIAIVIVIIGIVIVIIIFRSVSINIFIKKSFRYLLLMRKIIFYRGLEIIFLYIRKFVI